MKNLDKLRVEMTDKFKTIKWKHHKCGFGSLFENTKITRNILKIIAEKYNIKTVADVGAGDLSWIGAVGWDVEYTPYDLVKWHPDINLFDVTKDVLPKYDLVICRHVLNHLEPELRTEAINRLDESESTYIFLTHTKLTPYKRWGEPLETISERFNRRLWNYSLLKMN